MNTVRYGLPAVVFIGGIVLLAIDREREREEDAREYYGRHGRWPDEPS
jgi:hypothetical protein